MSEEKLQYQTWIRLYGLCNDISSRFDIGNWTAMSLISGTEIEYKSNKNSLLNNRKSRSQKVRMTDRSCKITVTTTQHQ